MFLFSGQGSHYRGMGRELFESDSTFKSSMESSSRIILQHTGRNLIEELYDIDTQPFDDLLVTHPAIIAVQIAMLDMLDEMGIEPDMVIGASLGEFVAAVASGILTAEEALVLSIEQAKAIQQYAPVGGMTAILSPRDERLDDLMKLCSINLASDNFESHFTVSGLINDLDNLEQLLDIKHISHQRLEVAYPFHSHRLDNAESSYMMSDMGNLYSNTSEVKMFSSAERKMIDTPVDHAYFWKVARSSFNFSGVINTIEKNFKPCTYLDLGPSGTMANFTKYNLPSSSPSSQHVLMSPFKGVTDRLRALKKAFEKQDHVFENQHPF